MNPREIVDEVFSKFEERGHRHYGESITDLQHALQAAVLARQVGESDSVILAALLHDYGLLLDDCDEVGARGIANRHDVRGANELARHFTPDVVELVRLHVQAKRYLCWKDKDYLAALSAASRRRLMMQGGPMSDIEAAAFRQNPYFQDALRLRRYDDMAKMKGMHAPGLESYRDMLESHILPRTGIAQAITPSAGNGKSKRMRKVSELALT